MYQKKTKKLLKRGSSISRMREVKRQLRRQKMKPDTKDEPSPYGSPVAAASAGTDKASQSRLLVELAWKTIALMHNNRVIQQKIVALQKETSDFLASIVHYPESKQYQEKFWLYGLALRSQCQSLQIKTKSLTNDVTLTQL